MYHDIPPPDLTPDQARWIVLAQRASAGSRAAAKEMAALLLRLTMPEEERKHNDCPPATRR